MPSKQDIRQLPGWILGWMYVNAIICTWDASFIMCRPHSLPGGSYSWIWYLYKYYVNIDKRYMDTSDPFVKAISLQNYVEVFLSIVTIILHHRSSRHTRIMAYNVNIMTMWKTVTYFLMFTEFCGAQHWIGSDSTLTLTFLFYFPNGVWIGVPLLAMYQLWPSFVQSSDSNQMKKGV
ncbi:uncharacterized protein LOC133192591 [Saccostrea echinata]|uniref:uncharacterized protein LOC133192591 n=1 Tax=Saccostrea echinata TaxID=191078 RepID=UPI002A8014F0|nr:uncharacterized protein LOC133192591 [Saccostrea echinata]